MTPLMEPTADRFVFIEARGDNWVRYVRVSDGRRWEVHGVCDRRGHCMVGAVIKLKDGTTVTIESVEHLSALVESEGRQRLDSEMDVPVTPEFAGCCPFTYVELPPAYLP